MIDEQTKEVVSYLVYESDQTRLYRIIHELIVAIIIAIMLLFISNGLWMWVYSQNTPSSNTITQDGEGVNIVGDSNEVQDGKD